MRRLDSDQRKAVAVMVATACPDGVDPVAVLKAIEDAVPTLDRRTTRTRFRAVLAMMARDARRVLEEGVR